MDLKFWTKNNSNKDPHDQARSRMVHSQIENRGITDVNVLQAMRKVPRRKFANFDRFGSAYGDFAYSIGSGQTISQPFIVALMTEKLDLCETSKVLEIGTGCGYQTAILAEIAESVYTIELVSELAREAIKRLQTLGYQNIHFKIGNGYDGWIEYAPYDRIIVTAAPRSLPPKLLDQLSICGKMILPIGDWKQELFSITKTEHGYDREYIEAVRFVPMVDR